MNASLGAVRRAAGGWTVGWVFVWTLAVVCLQAGTAAAQEVLRNIQVVAMSKAGLSPDVIVLKMELSANQFDTTPEALGVLKAAGVADPVIAAMVRLAPASGAGAIRPAAGGKPVVVIAAFTSGSGVNWPYDMGQLQSQTIRLLNARGQLRQRFDLMDEKPSTARTVYMLSGEVLSWRAEPPRAGAPAGAGPAESAEIRYRLVDPSGAKLFEQRETIRIAAATVPAARSVSQVAEPLATTLAGRLDAVKVGGR
jgi:hypothetical protein